MLMAWIFFDEWMKALIFFYFFRKQMELKDVIKTEAQNDYILYDYLVTAH